MQNPAGHDVIWSNPALRAAQTARYLAQTLDFPRKAIQLRERLYASSINWATPTPWLRLTPCLGYLSDSDFGDGLSKTNKKGHRVQLGYELSKNWSTDFTFLNYERVEDFASAKEDHVNLYQFDVNYKF